VRKQGTGGAFVMTGKKGRTHDPGEVKLKAERMFFEEGMTYAEFIAVLGLRSAGRVEVWARQCCCEGIETFSKPIGRPGKQGESEQAEVERLRTELHKEVLTKRNIG